MIWRGMIVFKDKQAQARIFDLHNLAPEIGEINALRSDDLYRDLPDNTSNFGKCPIEDTNAAFDPPDCAKGDLARVWFYVGERYGPNYLQVSGRRWNAGQKWILLVLGRRNEKGALQS